MSLGVCSAASSCGEKMPPKSPTMMPSTIVSAMVVPAICLTFTWSRAPNACPISTLLPAPRPMRNEMRKKTIGKMAETAASDFTPIIRPR